MELIEIIPVAVIILLAGTAQSIVGFGYALFSTPLLVWIGMPLPGIITLVATCSMFQAAIGAHRLRSNAPWRLCWIATIIGLAGLIAGLLALRKLAGMPTDYIRMMVGAILCVLVTIQFFWRVRPVEKTHWGWAGFAFIASGFLRGICGMGGPPLVFWAMAHNWSSMKIRGFLFAVFATSLPIQIVLLYFTFGVFVLRYLVLGAMMLPLVYGGARMGLVVGDRLPRQKLRYIAYAILLVIGISSIFQPLMRLIRPGT